MTQNVQVPGVGTIQFPDGMSQQDMAAAIQKNFPQIHNQQQVKQWTTDAQDSANPLVPAGAALTDTGRALKQLFALGVGAQNGTSMANYTGAKAQNDAADAREQPARDAFQKNHPSEYAGIYAPTSVLSMAPLGEVAGGIGRAGVVLGTGIDAGPINPGMMARAAAWAAPKALQGAAYGAQVPGDTPTNIAAGVALGPATEALIGGGLRGIKAIPGVTTTISEFGNKLFKPEATAKNTVQSIINASKAGAPNAPVPNISGVNLTAGGQSMDPGLQSLEQAVRSRAVNGLPNEAVFQANQRANTATVHNTVNSITDSTVTPDKTSTSAYDALQAAKDARRETERGLWSKVPMDTQVDAAKTTSALDGYINKQTVSDQRLIQRTAGDFMDDFKAAAAKYADPEEEQVKMPFSEIKSLRSSLGDSIRAASDKYGSGSNAVRLLRGMDDKLLSTLGDENALLGVPEPTGISALDSANAKLGKMNGVVTSSDIGNAYNAARRFTAETHNNYFTKDVSGLLDKDPTKVLDAATQTPDKLTAYLNAASQGQDGGASAKDAVRKYLLNDAMTSSSTSARGGLQNFVDGQKLTKYLNDNGGVLSKVFSPDELNKLQATAQSAYRNIASEAASPRVGSNTIQKFLGNKGLSGAMTQGDMGGGLVAKGATTLRDMILSKYQGATEKYLRDALLNPNDPAMAKLLQAPPTLQSQVALSQYLSRLKLPGVVKGAFDPKAIAIRGLLQPIPQK